MRVAALILAGSLFGALPAAADVEQARLAFASGAFLTAAKAGEAAATPAGYSIAARALLAQCVVAAEPAEASRLIARAERNAAAALAQDPDSVEARLQMAVAIGMKSRRVSISEALRSGSAQKGRRLLEEALARAPEEPWAHALMGGWHLEVLRRGGPAGAAMMGARLERGVAAFERARALAPDDAAIALHYAAALLQLDAERNAKRARALLDAALAMKADDAFESEMQEEAAALERVLEAKGARAAAEYAAERLT